MSTAFHGNAWSATAEVPKSKTSTQSNIERFNNTMPKGIPAPYNAELAEKICDTISTTDMGLEDVLKKFNKAISPKTWYKWQREVEECKEMISRARENQGILLFDRAHKVSLNPLLSETVQTKKEGRRITETIRKKSDNVERAKLIVWTLMRRAAVLNRNLGERKVLAGDPDNPIQVSVLDSILKGE